MTTTLAQQGMVQSITLVALTFTNGKRIKKLGVLYVVDDACLSDVASTKTDHWERPGDK